MTSCYVYEIRSRGPPSTVSRCCCLQKTIAFIRQLPPFETQLAVSMSDSVRLLSSILRTESGDSTTRNDYEYF